MIDKKDRKKHLIETDPDYIDSPKYNNSLNNAIKHNPEGFTEQKIAKMIIATPEEVIMIINNAMLKIRAFLEKGK